jgi:hypothetical protein
MADEQQTEASGAEQPETEAPKTETLEQAPAAPVVVDNHTARSDDDAYHGSWVDVVSGEHKGRYGALLGTVSSGPDGYPEVVSIRTRDADNLVLDVAYSDVRRSEKTGGR